MVCSVLRFHPTDHDVLGLRFHHAVAPVQAILADQPDKPAELPVDRGLMQRLSNFTLKDVTSGRTHTLYGYQGRKAIVLVFLGTDCPVGNLYVPRLERARTTNIARKASFFWASTPTPTKPSKTSPSMSPIEASTFRS